MSDFSGSHVDRLTAQPSTADKARRYLTSTGNADLLEVLGLAVEVPQLCEGCGKPTPRQATCRRTRRCETSPVERGRKPALTDAELARQMAEDYQAGASLLVVARRHHVGEGRVRNALISRGVAIRRPGGTTPTEEDL